MVGKSFSYVATNTLAVESGIELQPASREVNRGLLTATDAWINVEEGSYAVGVSDGLRAFI